VNAARPRLSLPRKATSNQAEDPTEDVDEQTAARHQRQAEGDEVQESFAAPSVTAPAANDNTIRVPADAWRRALDLVDAFERGQLVPVTELNAALERVEALGQQMLQVMGRRQTAQPAPPNRAAGWVEALRQTGPLPVRPQ